jgi:predicted transcriptional regulator
MEILWAKGNGRVREVAESLDRRLAYTTVMTTLDRLFKKGLLQRRKHERAFVYSPRLSRPEWERRRADELLSDFLRTPGASRELLFSCFLEGVGKRDSSLLDKLEREIRSKRKELGGKEGQ